MNEESLEFPIFFSSQLSARVWIPVVYDGLSPIVGIPTLQGVSGVLRGNIRLYRTYRVSGIPYFYLMQKKRIQGRGENNKRNKSCKLILHTNFGGTKACIH